MLIREIPVSMLYLFSGIMYVLIEIRIIFRGIYKLIENVCFTTFYITLIIFIHYRLFPLRFGEKLVFQGSLIPFINITNEQNNRKILYITLIVMAFYGIAFGFLLPLIAGKCVNIIYMLLYGSLLILLIEGTKILLIYFAFLRVNVYDSSSILTYMLGIIIGWFINRLYIKLWSKGADTSGEINRNS